MLILDVVIYSRVARVDDLVKIHSLLLHSRLTHKNSSDFKLNEGYYNHHSEYNDIQYSEMNQRQDSLIEFVYNAASAGIDVFKY